MKNNESEILFFVSFCIEQYKVHKHLDGKNTLELFEKYDIISYLSKNYEILHTQSAQWLMEEIDNLINNQQ